MSHKIRVDLKRSSGSVHAGIHSATLLNLLVGYNRDSERENELEKIRLFSPKVDIITDLSTIPVKVDSTLWMNVVTNTDCVAATVPIYASARNDGRVDVDYLLCSIEEQCEGGVGLITIHPTPNTKLIKLSSKRLIQCTSRGGGIVIQDMVLRNSSLNVYLEHLDEIISIARKNDVTLSIGTSFRSGTIMDSFDNTQIEEIQLQKSIADRISSSGVGVIIESPGHLHPAKMKLAFDTLKNIQYPIMPLGPVVTDVAEEYDDVCGAIGATVMGLNDCADILSIITSEEHTGNIPSVRSIGEAINKFSLAAHIIDLYKINDDVEDATISANRALGQSCIFQGEKECNRCGLFCPLKARSFKHECG